MTVQARIEAALNAVADRVEAGTITPAEGRAELAQIQAVANEAHALAIAPPPTTSATDIEQTGLTASRLAVLGLIEGGMSPEQAQSEVIDKGAKAFTAEVAAQTSKIIAQKQAAKDAAFARSPEGMVAAGEAAIARREAEAHKLRLADALLEDKGITAADIEAMSAQERISFSGIEGAAPDLSNDYAANLDAARKGGGVDE